MVLPLKEMQVATELAEKLYDFLPGKPHPFADQNLSFPGVATQLGLGQYWRGGSKMPAITQMLADILEHERNRFCLLVENIARHGISRRKRTQPITREQIDSINELLLKLKFKIPELHDVEFLNSLPHAERKPQTSVGDVPDSAMLAGLQKRLMNIETLAPVNRGFAFEKILKNLFDLWGLAARDSFRLIGEQIDGSFALDSEIYLLEARWRGSQAGINDLLGFSGKVQGKAKWSRGLFLSYAGFTEDGLKAFAQGRRTAIIGMDALDLYYVVSNQIDLKKLLQRKVRLAAETNRFFVSARDLFPGLI